MIEEDVQKVTDGNPKPIGVANVRFTLLYTIADLFHLHLVVVGFIGVFKVLVYM